MFTNYLKIALRNIRRHKGYALVNIAGLAVGMACCLLLSLYVAHELSYDRYHNGSDRIYRICTSKQTPVEEMRFSGCSPLIVPVLREEFSDVEAAFNWMRNRPTLVRSNAVSFIEEGVAATDDGIFRVLSTPFVCGRPGTCLDRPRTAVLTEQISRKYFGNENPIGKAIQIDTILYEITGVIADQPTNTHLKFSILYSSSTKIYADDELPPTGWTDPQVPTYVKLTPNADPTVFEGRIKNLPYVRGNKEYAQGGERVTLFTQPITSIHLSPPLRWEAETPGNPLYVYGMAATALLVLLIACANFLNLSTARAADRAMEVGIRKAAGALRPQLFRQFIGESFLITTAALIISIALAELAIPALSVTTGISFSHEAIFQPQILGIAVVVLLAVSLLAGSYPALFLSRMQPISALKSHAVSHSRGRRFDLRKALVVGQLVIVAFLVVGAFTVYRQMQFMRNQPLGFDKEQKLVIELPNRSVGPNNSETTKQRFLNIPAISGATISTSIPGRWNYQWRTVVSGKEAEGYKRVNYYGIDKDFLKEYGIDVLAGEQSVKDRTNLPAGWLVNETAVRSFGWGSNEAALEQKLNNSRVIGVIKDFHFKGFQSNVEPLVLFRTGEDFRYLSLRVNTGDLQNTVSSIESTFKSLFPEGVFNYFFLDTDFDNQYRAEKNLARICYAFTMIGIFVAILGLHALAAFLAQKRTKEIGVRKVFGATTTVVVRLLLAEFVPLLAVAAVIAIPASYLAMDKWLQGFAYRIDNSLMPALSIAVGSLLIVLASVSYQAIKAARANPVESLKYE